MLIQTDYVGWLNETITLLKQKNFDQVDWENLIEEIESLGRSQHTDSNSAMLITFKIIEVGKKLLGAVNGN